MRSLLQVDNGEIWAASHRGGVAVLDRQLRVVGALQFASLNTQGSRCVPTSTLLPRQVTAACGWAAARGFFASPLANTNIWTQMYVYDPATDRLDELTAADGADVSGGQNPPIAGGEA